MRVISIANQKGGTGKSTTVQELASIFSRDRRVLVIDMDQQCNLSKNSQVNKNSSTIFDLFTSDNPDVPAAIQHSPNGYDIIAGSTAMSKAEKTFTDASDFELLADLCESLEDQYDYVFVDNGPARNILLNMNYLAADYMILCIDSGEDSVDGVEAIIKDMYKYHTKGRNKSTTQIVGAVVSKYKKSKIGEAILEIMRDAFNNSIPKELQTEEEPFVMTVRNTVKVDEAKMMHQSLQQYACYSDISVDFRNIAKELRRRVGDE